MQDLARQYDLAVLVNIGIGKIDGEHDIVILHRRRQKQRPLPVDEEFQARKMARVRWNRPPGVAPGSTTSPRASNSPKVSPFFRVRGQRSWMDSVA